MGEVAGDKQAALVAVAHACAGRRWALVRGVALQIHQKEPRTTLDIDLALASRDDLPGEALRAAGLRKTGEFEHSENWVAADGTAVQFSDDAAPAEAIDRALTVLAAGVVLRVLTPLDLCLSKLRAARDPRRRRSKRLQDVADAVALCEEHPEVLAGLSEADRAVVETGG
ncbi:MAG: nucleotidyl transferase AbiEii/AbiGii toxin family protein [Deltaproteobacteria bacterium]|nr:nucleotidyl transferase AbiEii/AbiGii toxin family protein [Deltaproteobacteria bacterium]